MQNLELKERRKSLRVKCSAGEPRANLLGVGISAISMTYRCNLLLGPLSFSQIPRDTFV